MTQVPMELIIAGGYALQLKHIEEMEKSRKRIEFYTLMAFLAMILIWIIILKYVRF